MGYAVVSCRLQLAKSWVSSKHYATIVLYLETTDRNTETLLLPLPTRHILKGTSYLIN